MIKKLGFSFIFIFLNIPILNANKDLFDFIKKGKFKSAINLLNNSPKDLDVNYKNFIGCTPLHAVCCHRKPSFKLVKLLIDKGANVSLVDINGKSPLNWICRKSGTKEIEKIQELLVEKSSSKVINFPAKDGSTPIQLLCTTKEPSVKIIEMLLEKGAHVNCEARSGKSSLHEIFVNKHCKDSVFIQTLLIKKGAVISKNRMSDFYEKIRKEGRVVNFENNFESCHSVCNDFGNLFKRKEFTDLELNGVKLHKLVLCKRINKELTEEDFKFFCGLKKKELTFFSRWIYGQVDSKENFKKIKKVFERFNINQKFVIVGILEMLKRFYDDEETKDFKILVKNENDEYKEIKVHKLILLARSGLFRQMFLNCKERFELEKITDYSGRSPKAMKILIKFLYLDKLFEEDLDEKVLEELEDSVEYYQLNDKSSLKNELEKFKNRF